MSDWFDLDDAEEQAVAAFMERVAQARIPDQASRNASASELYCKARLLERWQAERRAQRPLEIMQRIEIAGGLVAAGFLLYLSFVG